MPFLPFHKLMAPKCFEKDIFDLLREISQSKLVVFIIKDDIRRECRQFSIIHNTAKFQFGFHLPYHTL